MARAADFERKSMTVCYLINAAGGNRNAHREADRFYYGKRSPREHQSFPSRGSKSESFLAIASAASGARVPHKTAPSPQMMAARNSCR